MAKKKPGRPRSCQPTMPKTVNVPADVLASLEARAKRAGTTVHREMVSALRRHVARR